jgi:RNA polymerase sigma-70 factor (ECF subfamily)
LAFERLVRGHYDQIYRWALVQTGDPDEADDVTQEVLVTLHRKLRTFGGRSRFTSWLFQVTRNAALQHRRKLGRMLRIKQRATEVHAEEQEVDDRVSELDGARLADVVGTLFRDLPLRQREVFDLADLQGYSPTEIAGILRMNPVTVRANLCKARRALRSALLEKHFALVEGLTQ